MAVRGRGWKHLKFKAVIDDVQVVCIHHVIVECHILQSYDMNYPKKWQSREPNEKGRASFEIFFSIGCDERVTCRCFDGYLVVVLLNILNSFMVVILE